MGIRFKWKQTKNKKKKQTPEQTNAKMQDIWKQTLSQLKGHGENEKHSFELSGFNTYCIKCSKLRSDGAVTDNDNVLHCKS